MPTLLYNKFRFNLLPVTLLFFSTLSSVCSAGSHGFSLNKNPRTPYNFKCDQWHCRRLRMLWTKAASHHLIAFGYYDVMGCACDSLCQFFGDCCFDFSRRPSIKLWKLRYNGKKVSDFACLKLNRISFSDHLLVINKCPKEWKYKPFRTLCSVSEYIDVMSSSDVNVDIPVTGIRSGALYRNMYCAMCHQEPFIVWVPEVRCYGGDWSTMGKDQSLRRLLESPQCILKYNPPKHTAIKHRPCQPGVISFCRYPERVSADVEKRCLNSKSLTLVHRFYYSFRNSFCAMCFVGDMGFVQCDKYSGIPIAAEPTGPYSFSVLLDLNAGLLRTKVGHELKTVSWSQEHNLTCEKGYILDPFLFNCKEIKCPPGMLFQLNKCVLNGSLNSEDEPENGTIENCPKAKLEKSEYDFNITHVHIRKRNITLSPSEFEVLGSDVWVCSKYFEGFRIEKTSDMQIILSFSKAEQIVSGCGMGISLVSLLVTCVIYCSVKNVRSIADKNIVSLIIALVLANLLLLFSSLSSSIPLLCKIMAICTHYAFLAAFSWMNVMAIDMWSTFSKDLKVKNKSSKRFTWYSLYAWLFPAITVSVATVLDSVVPDNPISPGYGETLCWVTSKLSLLLFFAVPLAIILLINLSLFALTARSISRSTKAAEFCGPASLRRQNTSVIYVKLTVIVGLTWILGFVTVIWDSEVITYVFIVLNSLQGFFVGLSCTCTDTFKKQLSDKLKLLKRTGTVSSSLKANSAK